jgi:hypothetical protein
MAEAPVAIELDPPEIADHEPAHAVSSFQARSAAKRE